MYYLGDTVRVAKPRKVVKAEDMNDVLRDVVAGRLHKSVIEEYEYVTLTTQEMVDQYNGVQHHDQNARANARALMES